MYIYIYIYIYIHITYVYIYIYMSGSPKMVVELDGGLHKRPMPKDLSNMLSLALSTCRDSNEPSITESG